MSVFNRDGTKINRIRRNKSMVVSVFLFAHAMVANTSGLDILRDELRKSISSILESIDNLQERLVRVEMATGGLAGSFDRLALDSYDEPGKPGAESTA